MIKRDANIINSDKYHYIIYKLISNQNELKYQFDQYLISFIMENRDQLDYMALDKINSLNPDILQGYNSFDTWV